MPQIEMLAHILQYLWLNSDLGLIETDDLLQQSPSKLLFKGWIWLQPGSKSDKVLENLVECLTQVLLVRSVQDVPVLPEDLTEDLLCYVLVLGGVLWIDPNDFKEWLHQVLQCILLVLGVLVVEGLESFHDLLALRRLIQKLTVFNHDERVGQGTQIG
jgi:hypothetical protein